MIRTRKKPVNNPVAAPVFGDLNTKELPIPKAIDYYNHNHNLVVVAAIEFSGPKVVVSRRGHAWEYFGRSVPEPCNGACLNWLTFEVTALNGCPIHLVSPRNLFHPRLRHLRTAACAVGVAITAWHRGEKHPPSIDLQTRFRRPPPTGRLPHSHAEPSERPGDPGCSPSSHGTRPSSPQSRGLRDRHHLRFIHRARCGRSSAFSYGKAIGD
jgi:hypothetical protein